MEYTVRSSYAEMPPQVIAVNSDRRAIEQAQHFMVAVGAEAIPALRGAPPSDDGEIAAFAVLRDDEVIHRGLVALKGDLWVIDSAAELVERAQNWLAVNGPGNASGKPGTYTVESPAGGSVVWASDDAEALESACRLDLRDPDIEDSYATTPFAVYSEEDGRLVGIGVQCMVEDREEGAPLHSFSKPVDFHLGWFNGIDEAARMKREVGLGCSQGYRVVLEDRGERMSLIDVIKAIRTHTEFRELEEAKERYFKTPSVLIDTERYDDASRVYEAVKRAGGVVRLETAAETNEPV